MFDHLLPSCAHATWHAQGEVGQDGLDVSTVTFSIKSVSHRTNSGNFLIIGASTATVIALTWGGIEKPWTSAPVLACLILGLLGLVAFVVYEALVPKYPVVSMIAGHIHLTNSLVS